LRLKTLKKLRTANLNSEFTGSYKKKVYINQEHNQDQDYAKGGLKNSNIL